MNTLSFSSSFVFRPFYLPIQCVAVLLFYCPAAVFCRLATATLSTCNYGVLLCYDFVALRRRRRSTRLPPSLTEYYVYEPLTAATLETIASSASLETSYVRVTAFKAKDIFIGPPARPTGIAVEKLKILDGEEDAHVRTLPNSEVPDVAFFFLDFFKS